MAIKFILPSQVIQFGTGGKYHVRRHEVGSTDKTRCNKIIWEGDLHLQIKPIANVPADQFCKTCLGPIIVQDIPQDEASIDLLNLSQRSNHALERAGILTIAELMSKTNQELYKIKGIGATSVNEIAKRIADWQQSSDEVDRLYRQWKGRKGKE